MLKFEWVEFENFLSNGSTPTRIYFDKCNRTLIRGMNGGGKTTVIEALNYVIFNKSFRGVNIPQLVNSVNKKKMVCRVQFITNGITYQIHRGQKPKVFDVYSDHTGEMVKMDATNDLQRVIEEEIVCTNYKTFNQVVVMASMKYQNFMDLSPADRRIVVNQMLDLEVLTVMKDLLTKRIKDVRSRNLNVEQGYNKIRVSIDAQNRLIESANKSNSVQTGDYDIQIDAIDEQYNVVDAELAELKTQCDKLNEEKPDIDTNAINGQIATNNASINEQTTNRNVAANEYKSAMNLAQFYAQNDHCDRCSQPIDKEFKVGQLSDLKTKCESIKTTGVLCNEEISRLNLESQELSQKLQTLTEWQNKLNALYNTARQLQTKLSGLMSTKGTYVEQKQKILDAGQQETEGYYEELKNLNAEIDQIAKLRAEVTEEMELCELANHMLGDNGVKAKIIKEYLPVINHTINHYLEIMGANYSFVLDEQFNETILSRYRDNFSYKSFSNGQAARINFAIVFMFRKIAMMKNSVSTNLLFLDEVLDGSLDDDGFECLTSILGALDNTNVFIISHRAEMAELVDEIIDVKLVGNFSQYTGN